MLDQLFEIGRLEAVSRHKGNHIRVAMLNRTDRVLQQVDGARTTVAIVHTPARAQAESPRKVDCVIGCERERRHTESVNIFRRETRLGKRRAERLRE